MTTLNKLIEKHKFDYVNPNLTTENFPEEKIRAEKLELLNFPGEYISSEEIIKRGKEKGLVPANIYELFALLDDSRKDVVALGTVEEIVGNRLVAYAWWDDSKRNAVLGWFESPWYDDCWFAFVRELDLDTSETETSLDLKSLELRVKKLESFINPELLTLTLK